MPARTPAPAARAKVVLTAAPLGQPAPRPPPARGEQAESSPRSRETWSRLHPILQRVNQCVPRSSDHVLRDPDRSPNLLPVGGVQQHPRNGPGALRLIEDPHLEVDEVDVAQMGMNLPDRVAQGLVQ